MRCWGAHSGYIGISSAPAELLEDLSSSGPSTPRAGKPGGDPASECSRGLLSVGRNCTVTPEDRKNRDPDRGVRGW